MTYKFDTQKKQNTSFQKRESLFSFLKTRLKKLVCGVFSQTDSVSLQKNGFCY